MVKVSKLTKPPYLLMSALILIFLVVTAFFEESVAYFDPIYTTKMSMVELSLTFSLCMLLAFVVLFISKKCFHIKTNWPILFVVSSLFAIDVVAVAIFPEFSVGVSVYRIAQFDRLKFVLFWLVACIAFYVFFVIMPKTVISQNGWNFYFIGGLFISLVACAFSYIVECQIYLNIFSNASGSIYDQDYSIVSFTNNKNTYGTLLLIGMICSLYLHKNTRKWFWWLFCIFLFANIIVISSRTPFIVSVFVTVSYVIYDYCITVNYRPILQTSKFLCLLLCVVFVFLIKPLGLTEKSRLLDVISSVFSRSF